MDHEPNGIRIGVYVGYGASHSWTWFVDLLEKYGCGRVCFIQEKNFPRLVPEQEVLLVSGGDTFALAAALESEGAGALAAFLARGGLYIGSCAGAYLPLHSSKDPLNRFNFVRSKINNLTRELPPAHQMPLKFSSRYGCSYVFHPVREAVRVRMVDDFPVWGGHEMEVPLYGGPPLNPSDDMVPMAFYTGFTGRTLFLTAREIAEKVYLGKVAACEKRFGRGRMVLLGPHFEHPMFPEGNDVVYRWIQWHVCGRVSLGEGARAVAGRERGKGFAASGVRIRREFKKGISNLRIRARALARESVYWRIGGKIYEPEKIVYLVETIWKRIAGLRTSRDGGEQDLRQEELLEHVAECDRLLRELSSRIRSGLDGQDIAAGLFPCLKDLVVSFLEMYFSGTKGDEPGPPG